MKFKDFFKYVQETIKQWLEHRCPTLAAALSFYSMVALAPLLILVVSISSVVIDRTQARDHLIAEIEKFIGISAASSVNNMILSAVNTDMGTFAAIMVFFTFLIGATGVFVELRESLNIVWKVTPSPKKSVFRTLLIERALSFLMIMGVGILLISSLVFSAVLGVAARYVGNVFPGLDILWVILNISVSVVLTALLFAMLYRFLPRIKPEWSDVWFGAFLTALLFNLGRAVMGAYLGRDTFSNVYGAAGSFIVILLWIYYSAQIFFLGAEFTQVYCRDRENRSQKTKV